MVAVRLNVVWHLWGSIVISCLAMPLSEHLLTIHWTHLERLLLVEGCAIHGHLVLRQYARARLSKALYRVHTMEIVAR